MNKLFAYGTLMWPVVLESVIGRRLEGVPAILEGFIRLRVKGEHYPVIVPSATDVVEGMIYVGLTATDFQHLDRFEGEAYDRVTVQAGGAHAQAYVLSDRWRHLADDCRWYPEQLGPEKLSAFCAEYEGWRDLASEA